jgi:nicotinate-nucleotide adenylyltransferase
MRKQKERSMADNIIIYGGAFDPVHRGHETMALMGIDKARSITGENHELWFLPSYSDAFGYKQYASAEHRLNMLHLVNDRVLARPDIVVSDFEIAMGNHAGTFAVVKALMRAYPSKNFKFLIGSDQAGNIRRWRNSRDLVKLIPFIILDRRGHYYTSTSWFSSKPHLKIRGHILDRRISSTEIRSMLLNPRKREQYRTAELRDIRLCVKQYIYDNDLYILNKGDKDDSKYTIAAGY